MNKNKKRLILSIIINIIIFIPTLYFVMHGIIYGAVSNQPGMNIKGFGYFKPFTMDSNILAIFSSIFVIIYNIKKLVLKKDIKSKWILIFHLMSTTSLVLTFLVTLFFLTPMFSINSHNFFIMYEGELLLFHFINPILSFISFILTKNYDYKHKDILLGELPVFIYSIIYLLMVIIFKKWDDFYNFTLNGKYYLIPFVFILINLIGYVISLLLTKTHKKNIWMK